MAPAPGGAVTAVLTEHGRLALFALDADGAAVSWLPGPEGRGGRWNTLGGRFQGTLAAVPGRAGMIDLFGLDARGKVHHCTVAAGDEGEVGW